jgi:threonine dehydrogenase-like Zn-dependent dehydrogenase
MRALTFAEIESVEMADVPRPSVAEPGDALVKRSPRPRSAAATCMCFNGRIPGMIPRVLLGHEFVGGAGSHQ